MPSVEKASNNLGSQAISRALHLISVIAESGPDGARLSEVAETSGLHMATSRRILQALVVDGFLAFDAATKVYNIGPAMLSIAVKGSPWFSRREAFMPVLESLARSTRDTVLYSVRSGSESVCLARCEGEYPIRVMSLVAGSRRPLGIGSGSLSMLAFIPRAESALIIERLAERYLEYNVSTDQISEMVAKTRRRGYAFNPGTLVENVYGVAVPILVSNKPVASISVTAIADRLSAKRRLEIVSLIHEGLKGFGDITLPPVKF